MDGSLRIESHRTGVSTFASPLESIHNKTQ